MKQAEGNVSQVSHSSRLTSIDASDVLNSMFAGHVDHKVVPMSSLLDPAHCSPSAEWSVGFPGAVCDHTVSFHRLAFNNPTPSSLTAKDVILTNAHGTDLLTACLQPITPPAGDEW